MNSLVAALAASLTTFAATNIDDVFLLTLFFARRVPTRRIVAGQYLGFAAIIVVSLIGVWAALAIPHRWIRVLGLLPLAIGIKELFQIRRTEPNKSSSTNYSLISIALVTLSNGADNVGVYVPFFLLSRAYLWVILIAYAVLIAIWCFVGRWLGNHSVILRSVDRWGHWAVPLVFIGLGIYVLTS
jgi:cadmium resistance protein CadD (predicted permease)